MTPTPGYLITGAGGGLAGVSRLVVEQLLSHGEAVRAMVHHDDSRADALRALGAEAIVGDLTNPVDVAAAMYGIGRMFFNMSVSADYLEATTVVCATAEDGDGLEVLVNMSQMTVSQMTATSTEESHQHRLHWLAEHVIGWSGVHAVQIRPSTSSAGRVCPRCRSGRPFSSTTRSSPCWGPAPSATAGSWRCRSEPAALPLSQSPMSPPWSPPCSAHPKITSVRSTS